jgi:hypothetical protein
MDKVLQHIKMGLFIKENLWAIHFKVKEFYNIQTGLSMKAILRRTNFMVLGLR